MDDLQILRNLLAKPGPSQEVADRGRSQLQTAIQNPARQRRSGWLGTGGRVRPRRAGWLAACVGLTAAVAAVAVTTVTMAPTVTSSGPPAVAHLTGRQILLAAATAARAQPKRSGIYWHVKMVFQVPHSKAQPSKALGSQETWTRRDGQQWIALTPRHGQQGGRPERIRGSRHCAQLRGAPATADQPVSAQGVDR